MQIILLEKINKLGNLGDIVRVKDGYARNFLIPQKKARRATTNAVAEFETRRADLEKAAADKLSAAQVLRDQLDGITVQILQKSGVDNRLFGSVTSADVAEVMQQMGFSIEKTQIRLPEGAIKTVGDHALSIVLHSEVQIDITVSVLGKQS